MLTKIKHDQKYKKFFLVIAGKECILKYEKFEGIIDMRTLFVPANMRGKGIAKKVVDHAVKFARKNNLKIKASCSYITNYFEEHPEAKDLLLETKKPSLTYYLFSN